MRYLGCTSIAAKILMNGNGDNFFDNRAKAY